MSRPNHPAPGPLSRRFDVAAVKDRPVPLRFEVSPAERQALAAEYDLPVIEALAADLAVARDGPGGVRVTGRVRGRVSQTCVVSLEEFTSEIDEPVDIRFAPLSDVEAMAAERAARPTAEGDEEDLPDPIVGGRIDLGALVAEIMALGLDPYPRKPGVAFEDTADILESSHPSPFAVLRTVTGRNET